MVQKELTITTPDESLIPLEFGMRLQRSLEFRKSFPSVLEAIDPDLLVGLECHIVRIAGTDVVTLNPSTPNPVTGELNRMPPSMKNSRFWSRSSWFKSGSSLCRPARQHTK